MIGKGKDITDEEIKQKYPFAWKEIDTRRKLPLGGENPDGYSKSYIDFNKEKLLNYGKNFDEATIKFMEQRADPVKREQARKDNEYASKHQKCPPPEQQSEQNVCEEVPGDKPGETYTSWHDPTQPPKEMCQVGTQVLGWKEKEECDNIRAKKWAEHEQLEYERATPINKFFHNVNKGLMAVADAVVSLPIPGMGFVSDLYKNFAPPGSKFFDINDRRSLGEKMGDYAKDKAVEMVKDGAVSLLKTGAKKLLGFGLPRDKMTIWRMAKASYEPKDTEINGWKLMLNRPTIKIYNRGNEMVIAVRGTNPTDAGDVKADASIAMGQLGTSTRFKNDLDTIKQFQSKYPIGKYTYSGVGHSLGGAIVDELIKQKYIKDGYTYNPAVSIGDFKKAIPNHRVYMDADPLYNMMGKHTKNPEVRKYKPKEKAGIFSSIASKVPVLGTAMVGLDAHKLDNFVGGIHSKFAKQLADIGLSQEQYLRHAKELARRRGYDPAKVFFAENGEHKLTYKDGKRISHFGRVGYGDFIIWSWKEKKGSVPKGYAKQKQNTFWKSHSKIKGDWKKDPLSPNNLALKILW